MKSFLPALLLAGLLAPAARAADFEWHEALPPDGTLEIKGISGDIKASAAQGTEASVSAHKTARRSDPEKVEIHVARSGSGVTICAVYPPAHGTIDSGCPNSQETRDNDVQVDFEVKLPKGVRLLAETVNGSVKGGPLQSDIEAHSVNGGVRLETTGLVNAETVNGEIEVALGAVPAKSRTSFRSVNGSIKLTLPGSLDARISARTVNGETRSDFPIVTTHHRMGASFEGTVGGGSADVTIETVNGSIALKRAP